MAGIARVAVDFAGGSHIGGSQNSVFVNGLPAQVIFGPVAGHGKHEHAGPHMITASGSVYAEGKGVCRAGDVASCGHVSTGSGNVFAG